MENVIQLAPNKWVTEAVLMAVTGMRPGTIKRAREKAWMQEREYLLFSPEGEPCLLYTSDAADDLLTV